MNSNIKKQIEEFSKNYKNLGKILSTKILEPNNINSNNYVIITKKGKYVLRKTINDYDPKRLFQMCKILYFLSDNKIKVSHPIKNQKNIFFDSKKKFYLTKFYEGKFFQGTNNEIKDAAKNLALLHKILKKNKIKYNFKPHSKYFKILTIKELKKIQKIIKNKKDIDSFDEKVSENADYLMKQSKIDFKYSNVIKKLHVKKQLIHGDLHPKNVIFSKNKVIVILDFNSMKNGLKIEDVAFASFRFASSHTSDPKKIMILMEKFLLTYINYNNLDNVELKYFHFFLEHVILSRISFLLKKRYFDNSNLWKKDLTKHLKSLKIVEKIKISII